MRQQLANGLFWVMLGGGLGASLRFGLANASWLKSSTLPYPTLFANILGCFLLGLLLTQKERLSVSVFLAFTTGFCGGLTTFSTLIYELWTFFEKSRSQAFWYFFITFTTGFAAFGLGYKSGWFISFLSKFFRP